MACSLKLPPDEDDRNAHLRCIVMGLLVAAVIVLFIALVTSSSKADSNYAGPAHSRMMICHADMGCQMLHGIEIDDSVEACRARMENVVAATRRRFPEGVVDASGICVDGDENTVYEKTWRLLPSEPV